MRTITTRTLRWAAPIALVAATGLAACGGSNDEADTSTITPAEAAAGSDVHLQNQADDGAARVLASASAGSDVHLYNQAADLRKLANAGVGSDVHLQNQADEIEARSESAASGSTDGFLPGARRVPTS